MWTMVHSQRRDHHGFVGNWITYTWRSLGAPAGSRFSSGVPGVASLFTARVAAVRWAARIAAVVGRMFEQQSGFMRP